MKKKILSILSLTLIMFFGFNINAYAVYTDSSVGSYEQELAKFPCDYQTKIKALHNTYPNAVFVAQNIFFDWNKYKEVSVNWNDMLAAETKGTKSLIGSSASASYRTSTCAQKSSSGACSWYVASSAGVVYYMNPYNFLDSKHVFMFESQLYNANQTKEGVEAMLAGTFMANKNCPGSNKTYSEVILEAASKHGLSAYMLAARMKQEQGTNGTSSLISGKYSGYENYYNYFNIKASGSTDAEVIKNGLIYAKEQGWTSPYLSIIGGAKFLRTKYIGANDTYNVKGQMTNYLQKWDPYGPVYAGQQYMQNIQAPYFESESTYKSYSSISGSSNFKYVFYIPIFVSAPNTTNTSCNTSNTSNNTNNSSNSSSNTNTTNNPYKVNGDYMSGIAQGTSANEVASKTGGTVTNSSGNAKNSGKIATGDKVKIGNNTYTVVIYGDINGDGEINKIDCSEVLRQFYGYASYTGEKYNALDVNKDGKIDKIDASQILRQYYGYASIEQ